MNKKNVKYPENCCLIKLIRKTIQIPEPLSPAILLVSFAGSCDNLPPIVFVKSVEKESEESSKKCAT